jgi:biopolymer transport protein ExbD
MKIGKTEEIEEARVELVPLIDCVFLLLIFFMCSATMAKVDITSDVRLPIASNAAEQKDPSNRGTVNILFPGTRAKDGQIASDDKPFVVFGKLVTDDELQRTIETQLKTQPNLRLYIRADRQVKFALVRRAMAACANAGIQDVIFGAYLEDLYMRPGD